MDQLNQVIYNILVTNYINKKVFIYIDPWGETLASVAWVIMIFYNHNLNSMPGQDIFVRYMIFKRVSIVD